MSGPGEKRISNVFNNAGTIQHGGTGNLRVDNPGTFTNLPGAIYDLVQVLQRGFAYQGQVFKSLSAVAKAITGSHCNGFWFFGLVHQGDQ
jgi:hypothetical protein